MKELVQSVMTLNNYPDQSPQWTGYEYVPEYQDKVEELAILAGIKDGWEFGVEFACIQCAEDFTDFKVCVDGNVWDLSEKEAIEILEKLK